MSTAVQAGLTRAGVKPETAAELDMWLEFVTDASLTVGVEATAKPSVGSPGAVKLNPGLICFSQSSVTDADILAGRMSLEGYKPGQAIDVVRMEDSGPTTVDNTTDFSCAAGWG